MAGHRFNPEKAGRLLDPKRKELISPQQVLSLLQMDERDIVADLGAGNGYFTVPLAKTTKEIVYAIDVQPEMLELLKGHAEKEKVANIEYIVSDVTATPLPSHFIDKGIMAFVFHEIAEWDEVFDEIKRIMKPNGKFLLIDWEAIESEMGPPLHERIPSEELIAYVKTKRIDVQRIHFHPAVYGLLLTHL